MPRKKKPSLKRPSSPKEARKWLRGVANYLSSVPYASNRLKFAAHAIRKYLSGKCSLEEAFALNPKRGAPGWPDEKLAMARQIDALRDTGTSWKGIEDKLGMDGGSLRRIHRGFKPLLMSDKVWDELGPLLKQEAARIPRRPRH